MNSGVRYLLDSNAFIEAKRRYYAFDLCPGFWNCLLTHHKRGNVQSVDRVKLELERGKDDLTVWAQTTMAAECFASTDETPVIEEFRTIIHWVNGHSQFTPQAKAEFADAADGWLVAFAKIGGLILVTQEVLDPAVKKRVPIPNVCEQFGVAYVNTFEMCVASTSHFHGLGRDSDDEGLFAGSRVRHRRSHSRKRVASLSKSFAVC